MSLLPSCLRCLVVVVDVLLLLSPSGNAFSAVTTSLWKYCRNVEHSNFHADIEERSSDVLMCWDKPWLGAKGFFIFFDILDDSIICNDSVFLVRWCKWTELAQEKRYLNCVLSCSSASLKVKVAVQLANLIPLFCLSALCLSLLSQWHIHKLLFAVGS